MKSIEYLHDSYVFGRRVRRLSALLADLMPAGARCLDVGSGSGKIGRAILDRRPDLHLCGVDIVARDDTAIPTQTFDGATLPDSDDSYDVVQFVDVLHHVEDPATLLLEAIRVTRRFVVIKDHLREGVLAGPTLRFMDRVGNRRFGVPLRFRYLTRREWRDLFQTTSLSVDVWIGALRLYPWPASVLFDRSLHFVARLAIARTEQADRGHASTSA